MASRFSFVSLHAQFHSTDRWIKTICYRSKELFITFSVKSRNNAIELKKHMVTYRAVAIAGTVAFGIQTTIACPLIHLADLALR